MIRKFFQSALCICLSPLLVAQQTMQSAAGQTAPAQVHVDLTGDASVLFLIPQPDSLAQIETGDLVQFQVETDVTSGDAVLLHAGVPVAGVVAQVKHSSRFHRRDGQIFISVTEMVSGKMTEVVVRCSNPADPYVERSSQRGSISVHQFVVPLVIIGFVLIAFFGGDR
ncbi:MAG: hypothetical protein ACLQHF_00100 [Terracidiphilus sp.]